MFCKICSSDKLETTYNGKIRNGAPGNSMTAEAVPIFKCLDCGCMWHEPVTDSQPLYQSDSYRMSMGEAVTLEDFYAKYDGDILSKLTYTGSTVYRGKLCMDIGCGGGGYADFINGVASKIILAEPNMTFAGLLRGKGYEVFSYAEEAIDKYKNKIEVLTTYDVIEHVDDPKGFIKTIFDLLAPGGEAFIGTPTDYPVLRSLLKSEFDSFVFSVQHPWVFSRRSLELLAQESGFSSYEVNFYQRFGIGNLIAWLQTRKPCGNKTYDFITESLDALYMSEMAKEGTAEYLILRLKRGSGK